MGAGYYIVYFCRGGSALSIRLQDFTVGDKVASGVLAIGVPTVVDAATIVQDAVFKDCGMEDQDFLDRKEKITGAMDELYNMYVTGKDVDYEIRQISHIICNAIHLALEL